MKINGAALLARKHVVTKQFGEGEWTEFFRDIAARLPYFAQPLLATSDIPLPEFLSFHDRLMRRFYGGAPQSYVSLGAQSARWAVTDGPYRRFIANKDFRSFVEFFPHTWSTYFRETASYCTTRVDGSDIDFEAFGLPSWHPYFEYFVVGYFKGALDLLCINPIQTTQVRGGSGSHYHYHLRAGPPDVLRGSYPSLVGLKTRLPAEDFDKLVAFVEEHLGGDIALSDLARLVHYSADHLARLFKSAFGLPLHQYVLRRRVERAKALLIDRGGQPIADIARACGFASQSHFTSVFKAKVGITPRAYRFGCRAD